MYYELITTILLLQELSKSFRNGHIQQNCSSKWRTLNADQWVELAEGSTAFLRTETSSEPINQRWTQCHGYAPRWPRFNFGRRLRQTLAFFKLQRRSFENYRIIAAEQFTTERRKRSNCTYVAIKKCVVRGFSTKERLPCADKYTKNWKQTKYRAD